MYRELKEGEVIQEGDEAYDDRSDSWRLTGMRGTVGGEIGKWKPRFRRPLPDATFEESADFEPEFIIDKEPVDEVIYPKANGVIKVDSFISPPVFDKPIQNKYSREIAPGVSVDVYDVLKAFNVTNSALQHLIKKALCVGIRGHKDASEDYQDIIDSAIRAKELG